MNYLLLFISRHSKISKIWGFYGECDNNQYFQYKVSLVFLSLTKLSQHKKHEKYFSFGFTRGNQNSCFKF